MVAAKRPAAWGAVLRSALLFTPFLAITLAAFGLLLVDALQNGAGGGIIVGLSICGVVALLFAYQVAQSVRDLFSGVVETTGIVERRWSRNDFFLFHSSYIFVQRSVFRLEPEQFIEVDLGDSVRVVHFPHTSTVESVEVVSRAGTGGRPNDG